MEGRNPHVQYLDCKTKVTLLRHKKVANQHQYRPKTALLLTSDRGIGCKMTKIRQDDGNIEAVNTKIAKYQRNKATASYSCWPDKGYERSAFTLA